MMKCYISGKITGLRPVEYIPNFQYASNEVKKMGYKPVDPVKTYGSRKWSYLHLLLADIFLLIRCGAIYMQRNWKESKGSKIEYNVARLFRKWIIFQ